MAPTMVDLSEGGRMLYGDSTRLNRDSDLPAVSCGSALSCLEMPFVWQYRGRKLLAW